MPGQTEATVYLRQIYQAQLAYFAQHNVYAGGHSCFELLGWAPECPNIYGYQCDGCADTIDPNIGDPDPTPVPCSIVSSLTGGTGFTMCASGNIDGDITQDEWIINDAGVLVNTCNDVVEY